jgi:hypothetical protein
MIIERKLSFEKLRMIVMALHNQGEFMRDSTLTFSHANLGSEYQSLAHELDLFVSDLEPGVVLSLQREESLVAVEASYKARIERLNTIINNQTTKLLDIRLLLGNLGERRVAVSEDEILPTIEVLKANQKRERRAKSRFTDISRAVDKAAKKAK